MNEFEQQDPFDPRFDPDRPRSTLAMNTATSPAACECGVTRRQALIMMSSVATLALTARADAFIPCVQIRQQITPCSHKLCRHYKGRKDYYGR